MSRPPEDVLKFLSRYDGRVREVALAARALVLGMSPDAKEQVHTAWKTISYGLGGKFCAISPHASWVNLQFHGGADLPDPHGLLDGSGKSMRHVKLRAASDLRKRGLRPLVRAAARAAK